MRRRSYRFHRQAGRAVDQNIGWNSIALTLMRSTFPVELGWRSKPDILWHSSRDSELLDEVDMTSALVWDRIEHFSESIPKGLPIRKIVDPDMDLECNDARVNGALIVTLWREFRPLIRSLLRAMGDHMMEKGRLCDLNPVHTDTERGIIKITDGPIEIFITNPYVLSPAIFYFEARGWPGDSIDEIGGVIETNIDSLAEQLIF